MSLHWTTLRHPGYSTVDYLTPLPAPTSIDGETATHVVRWYNRDETSWVVSFADATGAQIGSSEYVYSKAEAEAEAAYLINSIKTCDCSHMLRHHQIKACFRCACSEFHAA